MNDATTPVRIAMWSGPRNISTALMRSWGSRPDTVVCDEPLYAHYLRATGLDHPLRERVLEHHDDDWRRVVERLTGPIPGGRAVFYQKHMAHHLLPEVGRGWLDRVTHAFLIRDPAAMLVSLVRQIPRPTLDDTGLPQQLALFRERRERDGRVPPVIDARDVLTDPAAALGRLCAALGVAWDARMLAWAPGLRDTDGVWAPAWYDAVASSTGFRPWRATTPAVPRELGALLDACRPLYDELFAERLTG